MIFNYIIIFIYFFQIINCLHLNNYQINLINKLIQKPSLTYKQRHTINIILYKAYEKYAIKKAIDFKLIHKYKCSDINLDELILDSKIGLYKAIRKFNGKFNFINYSSFYIKSELLKAITNKYSLSMVPKKYRMKSKLAISKKELKQYKALLKINLFCKYQPYYLNCILINKYSENIQSLLDKKYEMNEIIYKLKNIKNPFLKRIIYLKYFYNKKKLTNKQISNLMCCSEETIRKHLLILKI